MRMDYTILRNSLLKVLLLSKEFPHDMERQQQQYPDDSSPQVAVFRTVPV